MFDPSLKVENWTMQLAVVNEAFGEVNVRVNPSGEIEVSASIASEPTVADAATGMAIDGSDSMKELFGISRMASSLLGKPPNQVEPAARALIDYLANFSGNGCVEVAYWACGVEGREIQRIGSINKAQAESLNLAGPKSFGRGTRLRPIVEHFVNCFAPSSWSIAVIITDGKFDDLAEVITYTESLAREIASGDRNPLKLVAIGLCHEVDMDSMRENLAQLDDCLDDNGIIDSKGDLVDLWDHKVAKDITALHQIFAEVVSENVAVGESGSILDSSANLIREYPNDEITCGLPGLLRFTLPPGSTEFTLLVGNHRVTQDITEAI